MPRILFDIKEMKPGCVLLQAVAGCDSAIANRFRSEHWLLAPTDDLKVYTVTDSELDQLVKKVDRKHGVHH